MRRTFKLAAIVLGVLDVFIILGITLLMWNPPRNAARMPAPEQEDYHRISEQLSRVSIGGFVARSLDGTVFSAEIFRDYTITMVTLWTTQCDPCAGEISEMVALQTDIPPGSNVVSICVDAADSRKRLRAARAIMQKSGAGFLTLVPDSVLRRELISKVCFFPLTFFVDSNGKVVGGPHWGLRDAESYRQSIRNRQKLLRLDPV